MTLSSIEEKPLRWHCNVLGIAGELTEATLMESFRREVKRYHPDQHAHLGPAQQKVMGHLFSGVYKSYQALTKHLKGKLADGKQSDDHRQAMDAVRFQIRIHNILREREDAERQAAYAVVMDQIRLHNQKRGLGSRLWRSMFG